MHLFRNVRVDDLERLVESCEIARYSIAQAICNQGDHNQCFDLDRWEIKYHT